MGRGVSIVIVASGASVRFGEADKLMSAIGGVAMLRRVAEAAEASKAVNVLVVCRAGLLEHVAHALEGVRCRLVENGAADEGLSAAIRVGVAAAEAAAAAMSAAETHSNTGHGLAGHGLAGHGLAGHGLAGHGLAILPGDLPLMRADVIDRLIDVFDACGGERIVLPVVSGGEQRNPVIWPQRLWPDLAALKGDQGGKRLIAMRWDLPGEVERVIFDDPSVFVDVDTASELHALDNSFRP